jgi:hypothetical protein
MMSRDLARYVDQQRSLGFKFRVQHILLRGYVAFAEEHGDRHIKSARVLAWATRAPSPEQRRNRLLTVRRFALAMHAENPRHQVPAADALGHAVAKRRSPYIYDADKIARLLRAAAALQPVGSIRPTMYATLFGLLRRVCWAAICTARASVRWWPSRAATLRLPRTWPCTWRPAIRAT